MCDLILIIISDDGGLLFWNPGPKHYAGSFCLGCDTVVAHSDLFVDRVENNKYTIQFLHYIYYSAH